MSAYAEPDTARAEILARNNGAPYMVAEIDYEDTRRRATYPLAYEDDPEFEAFDGRILAVAYPDGTVELEGTQ